MCSFGLFYKSSFKKVILSVVKKCSLLLSVQSFPFLSSFIFCKNCICENNFPGTRRSCGRCRAVRRCCHRADSAFCWRRATCLVVKMNSHTHSHENDATEFKPFKSFATDALHAGQDPDQWISKAVVPPISLATTFKQEEPGKHAVSCFPAGLFCTEHPVWFGLRCHGCGEFCVRRETFWVQFKKLLSSLLGSVCNFDLNELGADALGVWVASSMNGMVKLQETNDFCEKYDVDLLPHQLVLHASCPEMAKPLHSSSRIPCQALATVQICSNPFEPFHVGTCLNEWNLFCDAAIVTCNGMSFAVNVWICDQVKEIDPCHLKKHWRGQQQGHPKSEWIILTLCHFVCCSFQGFEYSRSGNPTRNSTEVCLAALENGKHCT